MATDGSSAPWSDERDGMPRPDQVPVIDSHSTMQWLESAADAASPDGWDMIAKVLHEALGEEPDA